MTDVRKEVHDEIDRMTDREIADLEKFPATFPSPVAAACRNAPEAEELETEEEARLVAEAKEWLRQSGGKGIPHDEIRREYRLE